MVYLYHILGTFEHMGINYLTLNFLGPDKN